METEDKEIRRQLRQQQRVLHDELVDHRDELQTLGSTLIDDYREQNNLLFSKTQHARESLNDVLNIREIAHATQKQAGQLDSLAKSHDMPTYVHALVAKYRITAAGFNWSRFGKDISVMRMHVGRFCPMLGPIAKGIKERASNKRKQTSNNANIETEEPENITQDKDADDAHAESTNERIIKLYSSLTSGSDVSTAATAVAKPLLDILVDAQDPVQTVENFFDFAFLIKEKRAMESIQDGEPKAIATDINKLNAHMGNQRQQMVLSLSMKDLRELSSAVHESCPLHRDDELYTADSAEKQTEILAAKAARHSISSSQVSTNVTTSSPAKRRKTRSK